jgi:hypothetical protein
MSQLSLQFDPAPVLSHPGGLNVHALMLSATRKQWGVYEHRYFGKNSYGVVWACACGRSLVGIKGGDK